MANVKRKNLPKKIRFEVFKRDSFTCQYCGRMAPDVILEVDHILPVAEGGTNNIIKSRRKTTAFRHGDLTLPPDSSVGSVKNILVYRRDWIGSKKNCFNVFLER